MRLNIDKDSFLASLELGIKSELKHKGVSLNTPLIEYDTESEDVEDLEVAETEEFINEENELDFNMSLDAEDEEEAFDMGLDDEDGEESLEESEVVEEVFEEIEEEAEGGDFLAGLDDDEDEEEVDYLDMNSDDEEDYEDADYLDMNSDDEEDYEDADYLDMNSDDGEDEELIPIQTSVEVDTTRKPKNSIYVENSSSENKSKIGVTAPKNPIITDNDTLNSNISDSKNIIYSAGMTIIEFLRKNPKARTETDVLKYFTKDALAQELKKGKVLVKRGKLFI